ncbi:MAG: FAD-binding oxidoreductase [Actinomycetia bacterium]|nr:FAD-binding oxidoreductase [Actinomycetes bacterium]MCP4083973.1 FAD-binding oxidoreductase [Actinomycetes bacterium]
MEQEGEFDVVVVGNGLFGSAAARHLAVLGESVALVGPGEPADALTHDGVFASHYDEGRLTRRFDRRPSWAPVTRRAVDGYRALEEESGIDFHHPVGALISGPAGDLTADTDENPIPILLERGIDHTLYEPGDRSWRDAYPQIDLPTDYYVIHEPAPAGHINPRRLIAAQNLVAESNGAMIVRELVTEVVDDGSGARITTESGRRIGAEKVLVAAGAFTNFNGLVLEPLPLTIETEVVAFGRVSPHEAARLASTPTVSYSIDDPVIDSIYMVPPVLYPDGDHYIKLGANTTSDLFPETLPEIQDWFRTGDSDFALPSFESALTSLWPTTEFLGFESGRCILCRTPSGDPMIRKVEERVFVATAGNGGGAKSSDTWGELAAGLVHDGRWPADVVRLDG